MAGPPSHLDPDDFVVLPNTFMDGLDGRTPIPNYNGEPRLKCVAGGFFQEHLDHDDIVVAPNGFSRVGLPNPPTYPNGQNTHIDEGATWPPAWWPTQRPAGRTPFQDRVPVKVPDWATGPTAGDILPVMGQATPTASAARVEPPPEPERPRSRR
jgi:hypothetical protein